MRGSDVSEFEYRLFNAFDPPVMRHASLSIAFLSRFKFKLERPFSFVDGCYPR